MGLIDLEKIPYDIYNEAEDVSHFRKWGRTSHNSRNYYSPLNNPRMRIDKDGDVLLSFIGNGREIPMEYKLFWVEDARWFGYKDVTYRPQPAAPTAPQAPVYYEPEYTYESYYEPSTPEEASYSYEEEELYYEETSVVGS